MHYRLVIKSADLKTDFYNKVILSSPMKMGKLPAISVS
jgi:hypothetical protein